MSEETKAVEVVPDPKRGLVVKLCEVMAAVGYLQKRGENTASNQGYKYATEADVAERMRGEFAKRNVFIFPSLIKFERNKLSGIKYDKVVESFITDITMRWTIVDGDTGQERVCDIPGCSASPGDKQVYVAMTGSEKYLLMKSFLIPTGDDPENDSNEPQETRETARAEAKAVGEAKVADLKKKAPPKASDNGASLFYALQPSGKYAVTGDIDLMRRIYKQFKAQKFEDKDGVFYSLDDEQINLLQFECKEGNIPLKQLQGPKS